jgi:hypothetical protein
MSFHALPLGGRVDEDGYVARDVAALDGDGERPRQDAVVPQHGGGGVMRVEQVGVELVEVRGPQPVDAMPADPWDQPAADS